jgi:hypothetical protein
MLLGLTLAISVLLHILIPSIFLPLFFLGILVVFILSKQYWSVFIWCIIIILLIQVSSLTPWWQNSLYYAIWILCMYISSISLDKGWLVQSIIATISLLISNLIVNGFIINYMSLVIYALVNGLGIAIVLYTAEKLKIYEKIV